MFCFSCGSLCKTRKGLENHLKSRPGCLVELGLSSDSNWAVTLGLASVTTSSKSLNHHTFHVETDTKTAAKRPVDVMWHDENTLDVESSSTDSPFKSLKCSTTASSRGPRETSFIIQNRCGNKKITMSREEHATRGLPKHSVFHKLSCPSPFRTDLSLSQIQHLCSLMDHGKPENFIDDGSNQSDVAPDDDDNLFADVPPDDVNDINRAEEERIFANAKMYTDRGDGNFTKEEILSIGLLGIMRDIGAPLQTYGRIVALFKDVITEQEPITTTFRQQHTAIKHFSTQFCMKGLYQPF